MSALKQESNWQQASRPVAERPTLQIIEGDCGSGSSIDAKTAEHHILHGADAVAATIDVKDFVDAISDPMYQSFRERALEYRKQLIAEGRSS